MEEEKRKRDLEHARLTELVRFSSKCLVELMGNT